MSGDKGNRTTGDWLRIIVPVVLTTLLVVTVKDPVKAWLTGTETPENARLAERKALVDELRPLFYACEAGINAWKEMLDATTTNYNAPLLMDHLTPFTKKVEANCNDALRANDRRIRLETLFDLSMAAQFESIVDEYQQSIDFLDRSRRAEFMWNATMAQANTTSDKELNAQLKATAKNQRLSSDSVNAEMKSRFKMFTKRRQQFATRLAEHYK